VVGPRDYVVLREIAKGGIGKILLAHDESLKRHVALKQLLQRTPGLEERFRREALLTARLTHPSIVPVYESGRWPSGEPFYVMKLVSGQPFSKVIAEARAFDQRLALLPHVLAVAEAIAYAHSEGIIHRDLKPQNILVGPFGETVVIDWGLAKDLRDRSAEQEIDERAGDARPSVPDNLTVVGAVLGTPAYMPPEQALGLPVDERADVYSLGAILYHLLAGRGPYEGRPRKVLEEVRLGPPEPVEQRQRGVPRDLVTIVEKAMARDPAARYPSGKELAEDLRRFQTGQIVQAHHYSASERVFRFVRRYRAALGTLGVALAVIAVLSAISILRVIEAKERANQERARAVEATQKSRKRADTLMLSEARSAVGRNPLLALAWLKGLSPEFQRPRSMRLIAADAVAMGIPRLLRGHTAFINHARFSPDGRLLATTSDDHTARLWDVETGRGRVLEGHTDEVWKLDFSPDGRMLATASKDRTVRIWDTQTGQSKALEGHEGPVSQVQFFDGGRRLLTRSRNGKILLWDVSRGTITTEVAASEGNEARLSPDGRVVAYTDEDFLALFDIESGTTRRFEGQEGPATAIAFSPDGQRVATGNESGRIGVWDRETSALSQLSYSSAGIRSVYFMPGSSRLLSVSDSTLRIADLRTGRSEALQGHTQGILAAAISGDGAMILSGAADQTTRLWDVASRTGRIVGGQIDTPMAVAFSRDGRRAAIAGLDGLVRLYELDTLRDRALAAGGGAVEVLVASPDGGRVAFAGQDGGVHVVDVERAAAATLKHEGEVLAMAFSPDGTRVALAGADGRVCIEAMGSGAPLMFDGHEGKVHGVAFSPDGARVVSAGADGTVRLWPSNGGAGEIVERRSSEALAVAFSPDGARLASAFQDGVVMLRDLRSGRAETLVGHQGPVSVLAFSPDEHVLASGGADHTVRLWDAKTGSICRVIEANGTGLTRLVFFPDGKRFATLGGESPVRLWEVAGGSQLEVLRGHNGVVHGLSVSPDGTRIATAGRDGTVRLWDLEAKESRVLVGHAGPVSTVTFALGGRALVSAGQDGTVRRWMDDLPADGPAIRAFIEAATPETTASLGIEEATP
jgi:WD40 repeat protein